MTWTEIIVHTTTAGADPVSDLLMEEGAAGTQIEDRADIPDPAHPHGFWEIIDPSLLASMPEDVLVHAWFPADDPDPARPDRLRAALDRLRASGEAVGPDAFGSLSMAFRSADDSDWQDTWKQYWKPFSPCPGLIVCPSWERCTPAPGERVLSLDPGMAFGSGTHETTALCLSLLRRLIRGGESVVDVGTGSGILAIAAAMFGASSVLAVDIDPDAVRVAAENAERNGVASVVTVKKADLLKGLDLLGDILVANIISDIIISFASAFLAHLAPGGRFICSGIVRERADEVRAALENAGFRVLERLDRGEWVAFLSEGA